VLLQSRAKPLFAVIISAGLLAYLVELRAILRARKRRKLDWALKSFLTAAGLLVPVMGIGCVLSWPDLPMNRFTGQLENVYGLVALLGVVTIAILGMLFKIVPFLVWQARYSPLIGRSKVPSLADLYSARLQAWSYWLYLGGLAAMIVAALLGHEAAVRGSCVLLASGLGLFALNLGRILSHLRWPRVETFTVQNPAAGTAPA
jgi:hypothetical protein